MSDPTNQTLFDEIRVKTRCNVRPYIAGPVAIDAALRMAHGGGDQQGLRPWDDPSWGVNPDEPVFAPRVGRSAGRGGEPPATPSREVWTEAAVLEQLRTELVELRALLARDERVLRKLMGLLVDKGICSREELIARIQD